MKKRGLLSAEQERELSAIGFKWKPGDDRWNQMLERLEHYHAQHGDCLVPWQWNEDRQLATWVRTQRFFRAAGRLSDERIKALDKLGFQWDIARTINRAPKEAWDVMFGRLEGFVKENGHAHVPQNLATDRKLGRWVSTQRQHHRKGLLDQERVERLQSVGFTWRFSGGETAKGQPVPIFEEPWRRMLEALRRFRVDRGHCRVPAGWAANPQLANWVGVQRRMRKLGRLSPDRIAALDEIGFSWNPAPLISSPAFRVTDSRPDMLDQLAAFKKQFGHCRVPQRWPINRRLADWVSAQRSLRNRGRITPDHERALADLGFDWDPTTSKWEAMFLELKAFKAKNGHTNVPGNSREYARLANWVKNQRRDRKLGRPITVERARRLDELGFVWTFVTPTNWEEMYAELVAFKREHGHCNVPQRWPPNLKLGRWVNTQRWRSSRLTAERKRMLTELGFVWNTLAAIDRHPVYNKPAADAVDPGATMGIPNTARSF